MVFCLMKPEVVLWLPHTLVYPHPHIQRWLGILSYSCNPSTMEVGKIRSSRSASMASLWVWWKSGLLLSISQTNKKIQRWPFSVVLFDSKIVHMIFPPFQEPNSQFDLCFLCDILMNSSFIINPLPKDSPLVLQGIPSFSSQVWLALVDLCGRLKRMVWGFRCKWEASEWVKGYLGLSSVVSALQFESSEKSELVVFLTVYQRESLVRLFDLKQKIMHSPPFFASSSFSTFCLRTTSKNQMCWCQKLRSYC